MKTSILIQSLGLAVLLAMSAGALAQTAGDFRPGFNYPDLQESLHLKKVVDERQNQQMNHILSGLYEKRINAQEFRRLMDGQREIQQMELNFLSDGLLSRVEYQKLDSALYVAGRSIFDEGPVAQDRPGYGSGYGNWSR